MLADSPDLTDSIIEVMKTVVISITRINSDDIVVSAATDANRRLLQSSETTGIKESFVTVTCKVKRTEVETVKRRFQEAIETGATGRSSIVTLIKSYALTNAEFADASDITIVTIEDSEEESVEGAFVASSELDVRIETSNVIDRTVFWEAACTCDAEASACTTSEDMDMFEFRTSVAVLDTAIAVQDAKTSAQCHMACKLDASCTIALYNTETFDSVRCHHHRDMQFLRTLAIDPMGALTVRVKTSKCPALRLREAQLCYTDDENVNSCVHLTEPGVKERFYMHGSSQKGGYTFREDGLVLDLNGLDVEAITQNRCWSHMLDPVEAPSRVMYGRQSGTD